MCHWILGRLIIDNKFIWLIYLLLREKLVYYKYDREGKHMKIMGKFISGQINKIVVLLTI